MSARPCRLLLRALTLLALAAALWAASPASARDAAPAAGNEAARAQTTFRAIGVQEA